VACALGGAFGSPSSWLEKGIRSVGAKVGLVLREFGPWGFVIGCSVGLITASH
jgi:hypothetical protein